MALRSGDIPWLQAGKINEDDNTFSCLDLFPPEPNGTFARPDNRSDGGGR